MEKRRKLTKTEKRDLRDSASLGISMASLGIGLASLMLAFNKKPKEDRILYSESKGRIRLRCAFRNPLETPFIPSSETPCRSGNNDGASSPCLHTMMGSA